MPPAQAQTYQSRTSAAASGTRRPLSVPVPVSRAAEAQYDDEQWQRPPNAANMQHTVDFRRSWVPSPEMRGLFPLPPPGERRGTPSYAQGYVAGAHAHAQRPVMPPMARARQVHEGGDEEKREGGRMLHRQSVSVSHTHTQPAGQVDLSFFPRARPRAATVTGAAIGTSNGMGMGNETASRTHAGNGSARHSLHIPASTGRPRDQAPEAGQIWRSVRESQVQRGLHAAAEPGPAPERAGGLRANGNTNNRSRSVNGDGGQRDRPKSWLSLLHPKRLFRRGRTDAEDLAEAEAEDDELANWPYSTAREVTPAQWRAYGAWARPYIDRPWGMVVHNATPLDPPRELSPPQVNAMLATLRDPDGTLHPERWAPRVEHPSLPPRPDLWPTPQLDAPELPPEALQLNPFLQHRIVGRPPLHFDLRYRAEDIQLLGVGASEAGPSTSTSTSAGPSTSATAPMGNGYGYSSASRARRREPVTLTDFYIDGPNGAQPATYPGVPSLKITALAGDPRPEFLWPVTVLAHHERLVVQVADVLNALIANFEERMFQHEVAELSEDRGIMVRQAYWRRMRLPVGGVTPPEGDGLRRVDYLGDATYFRGLAPAGDGEGFMLFLGPPP